MKWEVEECGVLGCTLYHAIEMPHPLCLRAFHILEPRHPLLYTRASLHQASPPMGKRVGWDRTGCTGEASLRGEALTRDITWLGKKT